MRFFEPHVLQGVLLGFLVLYLPGCTSLKTEPVEEAAYLEEQDVTYGIIEDVELLLDIAYPTSGKRRFPALVFMYGRNYHLGNRVNFQYAIREAAKRGYVAATISYRTTLDQVDGVSKYQFPAQLHDAKCAVRWLRANAKKYKIDPKRIGVVGFDSGGNLALMVGLTDPSDGLEGQCGDMSFSSRVQAVVNLAGETDMVMHYSCSSSANFYYIDLLGGTPEQVPERYKAASPVTYITRDDPPVLSYCGENDDRLPQAEFLNERMNAIGASHALIVKQGARHRPMELCNFTEENPVWDFLDEHLK